MPVEATKSIEALERLRMNLWRKQIPGLDGIRGIAALSVVGFHDWEISRHDLSGRIYPGRFAVQIFFVISGLLITWLLLQEKQRDGEVSRTRFYWRRAFRLFPALLALLVFEHFTHLHDVPTGAQVATLFYFANYYAIFHGGVGLGGLGQTWSLSVEEHFYLIWPLVFILVRNRRTLLKGCIVVVILQIAWRLAAGFHGNYVYAELATETAASAPLIGCILALFLWHSALRLPRFVLHPILTPISLAVIIGLGQLPRDAQLFWGVPLGLPFAAILVLQAITYEWRLLENPVARYFGRISYSVYLWGLVAVEIVRRIGHDRFHLPAFAVAIAIGSASYFIVERPFQSLGRKWMPRPKEQVSSSAAD